MMMVKNFYSLCDLWFCLLTFWPIFFAFTEPCARGYRQQKNMTEAEDVKLLVLEIEDKRSTYDLPFVNRQIMTGPYLYL